MQRDAQLHANVSNGRRLPCLTMISEPANHPARQKAGEMRNKLIKGSGEHATQQRRPITPSFGGKADMMRTRSNVRL